MAKGKKRMTTHKKVRQDGRPNGKSFKQHPKGFTTVDRRLVTVSQELKGTTGSWL
jgi:hypothetical protein